MVGSSSITRTREGATMRSYGRSGPGHIAPAGVSRLVSADMPDRTSVARRFAVMQILVMAKSPVAGQVKTRLCPPCTPEQAAALAEAALCDTLDAALATGVPVVLALAGPVMKAF